MRWGYNIFFERFKAAFESRKQLCPFSTATRTVYMSIHWWAASFKQDSDFS